MIKNFFRAFLATVFILGAIGMNAQTNIYVYKNDGTANKYDLAAIDSISFAVPQESNLLVNPGFEIPDDQTDNLPAPSWLPVDKNWFTTYYPAYTTNTWTSANRVGGGTDGDTFFTSGNGTSIASVRTGTYVGRLLLSATSGMYQLVNVTPGDYQICVNLAIAEISQSVIKSNEAIKILSEDGTTTYGTLPIPAIDRTLMTLVGNVTIPEGVTRVRFQLDQRDYAATPNGQGRAPLMLFDECKFCRDFCAGTENFIDTSGITMPIRKILAEYYVDADGNPTLYFGSAPGTITPSPNNTAVNREFSYLTPGDAFKETQIHPDPDTWDWSYSDPWIQAAKTNGQVLRMHGPIGTQCSPWAKDNARTPAELKQNLTEYMTALCQRYNKESDVIKWMDVVNETLNSDGTWFYKAKNNPSANMNPWPGIGYDTSPEAMEVDAVTGVPLYISYAFDIATQYAPDIKHIINQHCNNEDAVTSKMKKLVTYLRNKGYRVDGLAWQAHVNIGWEKTAANVTRLNNYIDWCHANGLEFHITELNLAASSDLVRTTAVNEQAATFLAILTPVVEKRKTGFVAINLWGMKSCGTSDGGSPLCGPWACNGSVLPAATGIKEMLVAEATK